MTWDQFEGLGGTAWRSGDWIVRPWFGSSSVYVAAYQGHNIGTHTDPVVLMGMVARVEPSWSARRSWSGGAAWH
jgi:hypothetical protein